MIAASSTAAARGVRLLASVTDEVEARLCLALGADVIDAKNPSDGALGALPAHVLAAIVAEVAGAAPVSATIGDLPCEPDLVCEAVARTAATGVDIVKIGIFPGGDGRGTVARLARQPRGRTGLVAVLLADRGPDFDLIRDLAAAGFLGVMLDTADKSAGGLLRVLEGPRLAQFVTLARQHGMWAGLAGSLARADVPRLLAFGPDILGFRGALCEGSLRTARIAPAAMAALRTAVPQVRKPAAPGQGEARIS